jgi:predicted LPLAT superfamily acyltransferase
MTGRATSPAARLRPWHTECERGSPMLLRLMLWIVLHLGGFVGRALVHPIAWYFCATSSAARAASRDYLARVLGRRARLSDVVRHFHCFASVILERVYLLAGRLDGFDIDITGLDDLKSVLAQGRGCVLLGSHVGSFEALRIVGRLAPMRVRPVMYRRNAGALTQLMAQLDPQLDQAIIELGQPDTMLHVRDSLAAGDVVGMLADRAPGDGRLIVVPFLGSPAGFPTGPFIAIASLGAPCLLFYGLRTGRRRYSVRFEPFADHIELPRADRAAALTAWVIRYAERLEQVCREAPFNWFNFYPFWAQEAVARPPHGARAVLAAMLVILLPLLAGGAPPPEPLLPALMAQLASVAQRRANFHEVKHFAALTTALASDGWLAYSRPGFLRKVTTSPQPENFVVEGNQLTLDEPNQAERIISLTSAPEIAALVEAVRGPLSGDLHALQRHYTVRAEGRMADWKLILSPTEPAVRAVLRDAVITGAFADLRSVAITQDNGDDQVMTIEPAH